MFKHLIKLQNSVESVLKNRNLIFLIGIFTFLYTVFAGPELPENISRLFSNNLFKTLVIFVVSYLTSAKDARVALFATIVFIFITNLLGEKSLYERFVNYKYMENFQNEVVDDEVSEEVSEEVVEDEDLENIDDIEDSTDESTKLEEEDVMTEKNEDTEIQESSEEVEEVSVPKENKPLKLKLQCTAIEEAFSNYY
jgi:hypothetical protein